MRPYFLALNVRDVIRSSGALNDQHMISDLSMFPLIKQIGINVATVS